MARKNPKADRIDQFVGAKVQELRVASGLSRQQLGKEINVTHQQLQKYEKGTNRISAGRLAMIAEFLGKEINWFFDGFEESNSPAEHLNKNQRMCIEVSRNFMRIKNTEHKDAVNNLVRILANQELAELNEELITEEV